MYFLNAKIGLDGLVEVQVKVKTWTEVVCRVIERVKEHGRRSVSTNTRWQTLDTMFRQVLISSRKQVDSVIIILHYLCIVCMLSWS